MKKIVVLSLVLILIVILPGCVKDGSNRSNGNHLNDSEDINESEALNNSSEGNLDEYNSQDISEENEINDETVPLSILEKKIMEIGDELGTKQIIFSIQTDEDNKGKAVGYEYIADRFEKNFEDIDVVFGRNGLYKEMEGDGKSPTGAYEIPYAFGADDLQEELMISYKVMTEYDYWVDDVESEDYNDLRYTIEDPYSIWKSFERMNIPSYRYGFVIDYNKEDIKGIGSAIFFHVWQDENTYTSGCTATSEDDILKLMKWLRDNKSPVIVQGDEAYFMEEYEIDIGSLIDD